MHLELACDKCGRKFPLSEEDVIRFWPRVFCLSCAAKIDIPIDKNQHLALMKKRDPDRRLEPPTK